MRGKSDSGAMQEKESVNQWAGPERGRAAHDGEEHFEWRESNPGIVTIKMICDGFCISLVEFFDTKEFRELEQELQ